MKRTDNGGPAFPVGHPEMTFPGQGVGEAQGMTLRDYFAAKAMQGEIAASAGGQRPADLEGLAGFSYAVADAMLAARDTNTTER